ncbi:M43 family zinc metalloprotease [Salegentibacter chungangensis]|uniref:M43 family zinc metalloprotease n=1 Tax=Salegentibacter chungangensis TaxID=1335724 RepID=A0ABW3NT29_9FLAO
MRRFFNSPGTPGAILISEIFIRISFLLVILLMAFSCSKEEDERPSPASIRLTSSTTTLAADGIDEVTFEVEAFDVESNPIPDVDYELYVNNELAESNSFSTTQTGEYIFFATVDELKSNHITVNVIDPQNALVSWVSLEVDNRLIIANGTSASNLKINFYDENGDEVRDVNYRILANDVNYGSQEFRTNVSGKYNLMVTVDHLRSNIIEIEARPERDYEEISIPVVFHIVHFGEPVGSGSNLSASNIISMLEKLNMGFSNQLNSQNANAVDTFIRFRLATLDENGSLLPEPGIDRINGAAYDIGSQSRMRQGRGIFQKPVNDGEFNAVAALFLNEDDIPNDRQFGYDEMESIGNAFNWDRKKYYNLYIVPLQDNIGAGGFAYYPFIVEPNVLEGINSLGAAAESSIQSVAPCVIDYEQAIRETSTVVIHEIGHTFGLFHPFSIDKCATTDYCADTYSYTKDYREQACSDNKVGDGRDNFMDYISGRTNFTYDQRERMRTVLEYGFFYKDLKDSKQ